jgi:hypothetical protein
VSRSVEREATLVRAAPHYRQGKARRGRTLAPMINVEFAGAAVLSCTYPFRGDVRLESPVRPGSVRSDNEGSVCFLHGAFRLCYEQQVERAR